MLWDVDVLGFLYCVSATEYNVFRILRQYSLPASTPGGWCCYVRCGHDGVGGSTVWLVASC